MTAPLDHHLAPASHPPRSWIAVVLSLLFAPLGFFYLGMIGAGLALWLAELVLATTALWIASRWAPVLGFVLTILIALGTRVALAVFTGRLARRRRDVPRPHGWPLAVGLMASLLLAMGVNAGWQRWTRVHVTQTFRAPGSSMAPAIALGDWFYAVPLRRRGLAEDAIVVFVREGTVLVKRVAALPGDTVEMRRGRLLRDGRVVAEPWARVEGDGYGGDSSFAWQRARLAGPVHGASYQPTVDDWGPLVVPADSLFLLGDNRHDSQDSRFYGFIPIANVFARPTWVYWSWSADSAHVRWDRIGREVR